jgi:hypothetical protein
MLESKTMNVSINRPWRQLYDEIWRPKAFSRWASGLTKSAIIRDGEYWKAEGPEGPIRIRFTEYNPFGVMDHYVDVGSGPEIYVPMRIIPNGNGAQALLTLFRQPGMSDAQFLADAEWVQRDLRALQSLFAS